MAAAVLAACAVLVVTPSPPRRRWQAVQRREQRVAAISPALLAGALVPVLGLVLGGLWGFVMGAIAAPIVVRAVQRLEPAAARRRRQLLADQLPLAVDLLAAAMAGGSPLHRGIAAVAEAMPEPVAGQLVQVARRLAVSDRADHAWGDIEPLAPLARAVHRAETSGVPIVSVLDDTARELHRDRRAHRRDAARRVGVRTAAPLGLCFLPAFFLVGIVPAVAAAFSTISW